MTGDRTGFLELFADAALVRERVDAGVLDCEITSDVSISD
jgi:hypothetical protein